MNWRRLIMGRPEEAGRSARLMATKLKRDHLVGSLKWSANAAGAGFLAGAVPTGSLYVGGLVAGLAAGGTGTWLLRKPGDWQQWLQGAEAEIRVGKMLNQLGDEGWTVMHDRGIQGSKANIDHLLISPAGDMAVLVDTKAWHVKGAVIHWARGGLRYGRYDKTSSIGTMEWEAERAQQVLKVNVVPVMCMDGGTVDGAIVRGRRVHQGHRGIIDIDGAFVVEDTMVMDLIRSMTENQTYDRRTVGRLVRRANSGLPKK